MWQSQLLAAGDGDGASCGCGVVGWLRSGMQAGFILSVYWFSGLDLRLLRMRHASARAASKNKTKYILLTGIVEVACIAT